MRAFVPSQIPNDLDPRLVKILRDMGGYLEQVDKGFGAVQRGANPVAGGGGGSTVLLFDHHKLSNLATYDDHPQYAYLPGRKGGQILNGAVSALGDIAGTWVDGGNFTSKNNKASVSTWSSIAIDTSAAVGDIIVLFLTTEFVISTLSNGPSARHTSITDSKGNTWIKIKEHQFSDGFGEGGAQSAWKCLVTAALTAGADTLTAAFTNTVTAMGITSHRWIGSTGISLAGITSLGEQSFVGNEPSSLALSGLPASVQYLFIRGSAIINFSGASPTLTPDTNYTAFNNASSSTNGGSANTGVFGEYRILSATTDSNNPSIRDGAFVSIYLALAIFPTVTGGLTLAANSLPDAAKIDAQASKLYLYGHDVYFRDVATTTDLSYIRTSVDGAFVGPIVPTPNFALLNTTLFSDVTAADVVRGDLITGQGATPKWARLAAGTADQILKSNGTDLSWITPGTNAVLASFRDDVFRIYGSADATKKAAFEVDGLTTATTRTLTVPDVSGTLILTEGASQTINGKLGVNGLAPAAGRELTIKGIIQCHNIGDTRFRCTWNPTGTDGVLFAFDDVGAVELPVSLGLSRYVIMDKPNGKYLRIIAGTTGIVPLQFTSGPVATTPLPGAIEFTTDDLFFTITTGTARKAFILDNGARLTSGRVPFATTNGRLIDDADFTFATDTLTITKIAATTLTGLLTLADAINIAVGTTTGTKIGTAASQLIGFWNTIPIVQPTTAIAAATFVANTSGIANDTATFDGYTIGQVVKALRNVGLLA